MKRFEIFVCMCFNAPTPACTIQSAYLHSSTLNNGNHHNIVGNDAFTLEKIVSNQF